MLTTNTKRMFFIKYSAGALQYVIFVVLCMTFLLLLCLQNSQQIVYGKWRTHTYCAILHMVHRIPASINSYDLPYNSLKEVQIDEGARSKTILHRSHWGIFDLLLSENSYKDLRFSQLQLLGGTYPKRPSLYLSEERNPLVLVGNTKVTGNVFLPKSLVKSGSIAGQYYYRNRLIYGNVFSSSVVLPKLDNQDYINQITTDYIGAIPTVWERHKHNSLSRSFSQSTKVLWSDGVIDLSQYTLRGNIVVQSQTAIRVAVNTTLRDVLLIAPKISIDDGVHGNFQAFASVEMTVGKNCQLTYPSVLLLHHKKENTQNAKRQKPWFRVGEKSHIQGALVYLSNATTSSYRAQMQLEAGVCIDGEVYCERNLDLQATVRGTVYTQKFVAYQFGSYYQNHLYNARINASGLPDSYVGLSLKGNPKALLECMY